MDHREVVVEEDDLEIAEGEAVAEVLEIGVALAVEQALVVVKVEVLEVDVKMVVRHHLTETAGMMARLISRRLTSTLLLPVHHRDLGLSV